MRLWRHIESSIPYLGRKKYIPDVENKRPLRYDWSVFCLVSLSCAIIPLCSAFLQAANATTPAIIAFASFEVISLVAFLPAIIITEPALCGSNLIVVGILSIVGAIFAAFGAVWRIGFIFPMLTDPHFGPVFAFPVALPVTVIASLAMTGVYILGAVQSFRGLPPYVWSMGISARHILSIACMTLIPTVAKFLQTYDASSLFITEFVGPIVSLLAVFAIALVALAIAAVPGIPFIHPTELLAALGVVSILIGAAARVWTISAGQTQVALELVIDLTSAFGEYAVEIAIVALVVTVCPGQLQTALVCSQIALFLGLKSTFSRQFLFEMDAWNKSIHYLSPALRGIVSYGGFIILGIFGFIPIDIADDAIRADVMDEAVTRGNPIKYLSQLRYKIVNGRKQFSIPSAVSSTAQTSICLAGFSAGLVTHTIYILFNIIGDNQDKNIFQMSRVFGALSPQMGGAIISAAPLLATFLAATFGTAAGGVTGIIGAILVALTGVATALTVGQLSGLFMSWTVSICTIALACQLGICLSIVRTIGKRAAIINVTLFFIEYAIGGYIGEWVSLVFVEQVMFALPVVVLAAAVTLAVSGVILVIHPFYFVGRCGYVSVTHHLFERVVKKQKEEDELLKTLIDDQLGPSSV